jgi:hypothetical protein
MVSLTRRHVLGGTAALSVCATVAGPAAAQKPRGSWIALPDMPAPLRGIHAVPFRRAGAPATAGELLSGEVFAIAGGLTSATAFSAGVSRRTFVYDRAAAQWSGAADLPEARHHLSFVSDGRSLFGFGGFFADAAHRWRIRSDLWRLDNLNQPLWYGMTAMPVAQAQGAVGALSDGLHLAGGRLPRTSRQLDDDDYVDTDLHWIYDPASNRWSQRRPLPTSRYSAASVVYRDALYVIGGRTSDGRNSAAFEVYEPRTDRWQSFPPLPRPTPGKTPRGQADLAAALWRGAIYVFGGEFYDDVEETGTVYADVWEYEIRTDKWRAVAAMRTPRHGHAAVAAADGIYVCGGATAPGDAPASAAFERFVI